MKDTVFLVLTCALVIAGGIQPAGTLVEVTQSQAQNFLHRGKARLATAEDGAPVDESDDEGFDLSRMNKAQLLEFCAAHEIEGVTADMTKAQIHDAIEKALESAGE